MSQIDVAKLIEKYSAFALFEFQTSQIGGMKGFIDGLNPLLSKAENEHLQVWKKLKLDELLSKEELMELDHSFCNWLLEADQAAYIAGVLMGAKWMGATEEQLSRLFREWQSYLVTGEDFLDEVEKELSKGNDLEHEKEKTNANARSRDACATKNDS